MKLRIQMITLMLMAGGAAAWAADTLIAQVPPAPVRTDLSEMRSLCHWTSKSPRSRRR